MAESLRIVIVGAGYGGVLTAKKLARRIKKVNPIIELVIIDKNPFHTMLTELHEVAADRVPEEAVKISLQKIFSGRPVKVIQDEVTRCDFNEKVVYAKEQAVPYDYLVIGTGSKPTFFGVEGAETYSHKLWSYEDAVGLKEHIQKCFRAAATEKDLMKRQQLLTFITVGAGFTGVEMIGELAEWAPKLCKVHDVPRESLRLIVIDQLPKILPIFPDHLIEKAVNRLERLGVEVITSATIQRITSEGIDLKEGDAIDSHTVIWAAGVESSELLTQSNLSKAGRGRIMTNQYLQSVDYDTVYAVGDNIYYIPEGEEKPVPQMVENAEHSSETVAHNILADIKNKDKESYQPKFHGAMVCIGGRYGLAHLGLPGRFFGLSGFFAMFIKHFINVIYFLQVAGFNKIWTYMLHEGFHVKDRRSFVGGHFSKASPNFWLLPLRVFVGYKWLTEGLNKLPKVLENPSNIFLIPPSPKLNLTSATAKAAEGAWNNAGAAADAVTSATQAVGAGNSGTQAAGAVAENVSSWGEALHVPGFIQSFSDFMMDLLCYHSDGTYTGLASVIQTGMVLAEIAVGFMLIVGLFTAVAAIVSIIMGGMIYMTGMAPTEMRWYWAAAVALIGGSGSVFGLDYFLYPPLKRWWSNLAFVKKYYLYTD